MQIVKEKTAVEISAAVRGDDGSIVTPTTLKYRVDCLTTLQPIKAWTTLTPTAVTTIPITAAENAIRDDTNAYEDRSLVVLTDEGLATQQTTQHVYRVENLYGLV